MNAAAVVLLSMSASTATTIVVASWFFGGRPAPAWYRRMRARRATRLQAEALIAETEEHLRRHAAQRPKTP